MKQFVCSFLMALLFLTATVSASAVVVEDDLPNVTHVEQSVSPDVAIDAVDLTLEVPAPEFVDVALIPLLSVGEAIYQRPGRYVFKRWPESKVSNFYTNYQASLASGKRSDFRQCLRE